MPRLTKIYTRKGDDGSTALGTGRRVLKDDIQVEAYGTVDELNSVVGMAIAAGLDPQLSEVLLRIQSELLNLGGELCLLGAEAPGERRELIGDAHVERLERECDLFNESLGALENFILPGGTTGAAHLHLARTVCRRAERRVVTLGQTTNVPERLIHYVNRLSDLLFILARYQNRSRGVPDVLWDTSA